MAYTNQLLQQILDAMPDASGLNQESTQQTIETLLGGVATEAKLEAVRAILQSIYEDCCPNTLLQNILDAMPSGAGGDYALETSMQTSLARLQDILDRLTSVEADLGYDALLDPLDTQKKSLDDVQGKLQDILDAMPEVDALMTEAKGEAIRTLLQSIYDDCCAVGVLQQILAAMPSTSGLATTAKQDAIRADLGAIKADTVYITGMQPYVVDLRNFFDARIPTNLSALISARATEATLQLLLDCCTGKGSEATLDQVRANTDHLDQMETDLAAMRADIATMKTDVAAIRECACNGGSSSSSGGGCCDPDRNYDEWEEGDPEWEGADPDTDPPPSGYASWSEWDDVVCGRINAYVEQIIADLSWWENLLSKFGIGTGGASVTGFVKGRARTFIAEQGAATLASKGLTKTTMVPGWVWASWLTTFVAVAANILSGIIKQQIIDLRCSLVNNIYGSRYGGSEYAKTRLGVWLEDNFSLFGNATSGYLAFYFLKTDFDILYSELPWTDDPFQMNPCNCYDNEAMFDPYIWLRTNPGTTITESGGLVTQWDDSGLWGGHFASVTAGARPALESGRVRFYASDNMRSYPAGHPKIYAVFVLWEHVNNGYILGRFNSGTSSIHYRPVFAWGSPPFRVALVSANGTTTGNCQPSLPTGYNLITIYSNTSTQRTYVRLNGVEICSTADGTGQQFVDATAFLFLGGHPDYASAGAQFHLAELAMYDRELTIDEVEAIEPAILSNNPGI